MSESSFITPVNSRPNVKLGRLNRLFARSHGVSHDFLTNPSVILRGLFSDDKLDEAQVRTLLGTVFGTPEVFLQAIISFCEMPSAPLVLHRRILLGTVKAKAFESISSCAVPPSVILALVLALIEVKNSIEYPLCTVPNSKNVILFPKGNQLGFCFLNQVAKGRFVFTSPFNTAISKIPIGSNLIFASPY